MISCIFIRKKLYDYLDNSLSEVDRDKIEKHLQLCSVCQKRLDQMNKVIELARTKKSPQLSEDFWHNFQIELDRKLNKRLVPELRFKTHLSYRLKPALVYASTLVVILFIGLYIHLYSTSAIFTKSDLALINEISLLEEVTSEIYLNGTEQTLTEEIEFLYQLNSDLT